MKLILVLLFATVMIVKSQDTYGTDHDNLDVEAVVANQNRFKSFIDCFTDVAPCDEVTGAFKKQLPESIVQACAKCTSSQKHIVKVFIDGFKKNMPQEYEKFKDTFDPERKFFPSYEAAVADY